MRSTGWLLTSRRLLGRLSSGSLVHLQLAYRTKLSSFAKLQVFELKSSKLKRLNVLNFSKINKKQHSPLSYALGEVHLASFAFCLARSSGREKKPFATPRRQSIIILWKYLMEVSEDRNGRALLASSERHSKSNHKVFDRNRAYPHRLPIQRRVSWKVSNFDLLRIAPLLANIKI